MIGLETVADFQLRETLVPPTLKFQSKYPKRILYSVENFRKFSGNDFSVELFYRG